jgi:hypothetical protein
MRMSPPKVTKNKSTWSVLSEEASQAVYFKILWDENLLKSWPAQMLLGKFMSLISFFKEQEYHSGFADGFPIGSLVTVAVSVWVKEKCFHDLVRSLSGTQFCRNMPSIITWS